MLSFTALRAAQDDETADSGDGLHDTDESDFVGTFIFFEQRIGHDQCISDDAEDAQQGEDAAL